MRFAIERWRSQRALKASQEKFAKAFMHSPVWVVISDLHTGEYLEVNDAFLKATGYAPEEVLGNSSLELGTWQDLDDRSRAIESIRQEGSVRNLEVNRLDRQGDIISTLYSGEPLELEGRQCLVSVSQDISAIKRAQSDRLQIEKQLQQVQKLESLGVMAGGIAHDFNNMLMGILGNAELARLDLAGESPLRHYLEQIETAAKRLADLTNQLLAYSGRGRFVIKTVNLSRLIGEINELLKTVVSKQAVMRLQTQDDLPAVEADITQMRQLIMNLITNASDALEERSGTITISTGVTEVDRAYLADTFIEEELPPGAYVHLEVSDTGVGMDKATQAKIFDPFFTTKFAGRGLGLAAVLGIIRGHKGAIKIYSEPGQGTSIKVLLPATDKQIQVEQRPSAETESMTAPALVLIVDDDEMVRAVTRLALERLGCRVIEAHDGVEGVETFQEQQSEVDLVILDLTMPRLSGEEVFAQLRRLDPGVRVLLTSGYNEAETTNRFAGKGLAGFIQKPYTPSGLRRKLQEILPEKF
ncbi:MAG: response regulator [Desulfarculaceae bacterium]|nr:response regulator [Desulfarculaceae bacterium]MCF8073557.1 response regulator [Desulfarculaceae bacterium]MCF8103079.1 response regulator [Desulfarculaceae bacterium]MCF8115727.1 response regulator [Desulfarculaceae bacterium]